MLARLVAAARPARWQPALWQPACLQPARWRCSSSSAAGETVTAPPVTPTRFAVMLLGGTQYKVSVDDLISVERLPYQVGQTVRNESVLLVGSLAATIIGKPLVAGAYVEFTVEEHPLADKVSQPASQCYATRTQAHGNVPCLARR